MNKNTTAVFLKDYQPLPFKVKTIHLTFKLSPKDTKVFAKILFSPQKHHQNLELDGTDLKLNSASINNVPVRLESLIRTDNGLKVPAALVPETDFYWEAETSISPETNTALEGLYISSGIYCTQCEAQGFRKITFFPDRPDVMAVYTVRIEGPEPILLSNGNLIGTGKQYSEWHDPWPKPSYLFALVAGNLVSFNDKFKTKSGRIIELKIYVKPTDINKCSYAMEALKRAMAWDEKEYQREYDLDRFMIVAINDFNMGAMENKGLNIFNSKYILADEKSATDQDLANIERIVAHEYFHNWTGNRITCRDWFQLSLKEGLTVFRDQQFSASIRGNTLQRIEDVLALQAHQFREDDGPLAHPVRPDKYLEINNFYTATVYEKGAEIVRMLKLIVGTNFYNRALQRYFRKYDGRACTIEDWLGVFEDNTKMDVKQFAQWYSQKGRPIVEIKNSYHEGTFVMEFEQKLIALEDPDPQPMVIPITIGLLDQNGNEMRKSETFVLSKRKDAITFDNLPSKPLPSTLQDFSAPITLVQDISTEELLILAAKDNNLFNRWNALQTLKFDSIEKYIFDDEPISERLLSTMEKIIQSDYFSPAYRAKIIETPNENKVLTYLSNKNRPIDPSKIYESIHSFNKILSKKCYHFFSKILNDNQSQTQFDMDPKQAGLRLFNLRLMNLYCYHDDGIATIKKIYHAASNMTDEIGALTLLIRHNKITNELNQFYDKWQTNDNVIDKWFAAQSINTHPKKSVNTVHNLTKHSAFEPKNPNRFRSVIGTFAANNLPGFHQEDGAGYNLVTDWLIQLDDINPQTTARVCTVFDNWKLFDTQRQQKMKNNLLRLSNMPNISKNTYEIVNSLLKK